MSGTQDPSGLLFKEGDGPAYIERHRSALLNEISRISEQKLLNMSVEDFVHYLVDKYAIDVPKLNVAAAVASQREERVAVSGIRFGLEPNETALVAGVVVALEVPFVGDAHFFRLRPSSWDSSRLHADVRDDVIVLEITGIDLIAPQVQAALDAAIADINRYLDWHRQDVEKLNPQLSAIARGNIERRRTKLLANQSLVAGLTYKLKARDDAPRTYAAPVVRRRIEPRLPPASSDVYKPEPVLLDEDYNNILKIVQDMTLVMERSPAAFSHMSEEEIRQHFLVQLNGHYEGKATGETFNVQGKTDILIRHEGRNIFIAECKFWLGDKSYLKAVDQVLSYLSWRDTKVAIIIFNKNRNFSGVLNKIREVTPQHPLFKSGPKVEGETRLQYVFGQQADPSREVVVTVLAFDVPSSGREKE